MVNARVFNTTWEAVIDRTSKKKLAAYFFPASVSISGKFTWKEILCNKMYKEKKSYTKEEFKNADWTIYFGK